MIYYRVPSNKRHSHFNHSSLRNWELSIKLTMRFNGTSAMSDGSSMPTEKFRYLFNSKAMQLQRRCAAVSSSSFQRRQISSLVLPMRCKWLFKLRWPVSSPVITLICFLFNLKSSTERVNEYDGMNTFACDIPGSVFQ